MRLGGMDCIINGPTTKGGITLTKSMLFSSANFQAACSAMVLDIKYIYTTRKKGLKKSYNFFYAFDCGFVVSFLGKLEA